MAINTVAIGAAVTPTVIETWICHYLNRKPRRRRPTAHITYDVGLNLIRQFLSYAATQTVDDLQAFTSQWVPSPRWVRSEIVDIPPSSIEAAAQHLQAQLGPDGIQQVGGPTWWKWRHPQVPLKAEWIEMRKDYNTRKQRGTKCQRCMLYIHGGAFFFGSVDEHKYQMQRHSRKLQARVFSPNYRLAPQYPFPCGLQDCLAAYLWLLTVQEPETIVLAGDSAGGGMVVSLLVIMRDQGIPLPAGAILLSPWVDLTHSFPSVAGENDQDYVPAHGFQHKPSLSWPPPNSDALDSIARGDRSSFMPQLTSNGTGIDKGKRRASGANHVSDRVTDDFPVTPGQNRSHNLSVMIDGKLVELKDQIQMYTTNALLSHPLVSPVLQPSLGGLPPLCVVVGGGEMLRDEQIYLAHKAANPSAYAPPSAVDLSINGDTATPSMSRTSALVAPDRAHINEIIQRYPPTYVQLQIWDDLCHVAATLSFTRPAKFMYRSIAQFGAWALARAQKSEIRILDDDEVSIISSASSEEESSSDESDLKKEDSAKLKQTKSTSSSRHHPRPATPQTIGRAGDPLPAFKSHMIRQRVTRHGEIYELESAETLPACTMAPADVGAIKPGPVRKWLAARRRMDERYSHELKQVLEKRRNEMFETRDGRGAIFAEGASENVARGERPPPTAWAGRRREDLKAQMKAKLKKRISRGLQMWSGWGSHHDEEAIENEEEKMRKKEDVTVSVTNVKVKGNGDATSRATSQTPGDNKLRAASPPPDMPEGATSKVAAAGRSTEALTTKMDIPDAKAQKGGDADQPSTSSNLRKNRLVDGDRGGPNGLPSPDEPSEGLNLTKRTSANYPVTHEGHTVPFKLRPDPLIDEQANASTITLTNASGIVPPTADQITSEANPSSATPSGASPITPSPKTQSHKRDASYTSSSLNPSSYLPKSPLAAAAQNLTIDTSHPYTPAAADDPDPAEGLTSVVEQATPVLIRTPDAARREHARASSKVNGWDTIDKSKSWYEDRRSGKYKSGGSSVLKTPTTPATPAMVGNGMGKEGDVEPVPPSAVVGDDPSMWADGVLREMGRASGELSREFGNDVGMSKIS